MKKFLSAVLSAVMGISGIGAASVSAEDNGTQQAVQAENKTIAFPGAEGGGMYSEGARSNDKMEVYHVTNLNDSGEGSFRDAVSKSGRFVYYCKIYTFQGRSASCGRNRYQNAGRA